MSQIFSIDWKKNPKMSKGSNEKFLIPGFWERRKIASMSLYNRGSWIPQCYPEFFDQELQNKNGHGSNGIY